MREGAGSRSRSTDIQINSQGRRAFNQTQPFSEDLLVRGDQKESRKTERHRPVARKEDLHQLVDSKEATLDKGSTKRWQQGGVGGAF